MLQLSSKDLCELFGEQFYCIMESWVLPVYSMFSTYVASKQFSLTSYCPRGLISADKDLNYLLLRNAGPVITDISWDSSLGE